MKDELTDGWMDVSMWVKKPLQLRSSGVADVLVVPPATRPDSPSWMATPNPPSLTGAEFSLEASRTQWGYEGGERRRRRRQTGEDTSLGRI